MRNFAPDSRRMPSPLQSAKSLPRIFHRVYAFPFQAFTAAIRPPSISTPSTDVLRSSVMFFSSTTVAYITSSHSV